MRLPATNSWRPPEWTLCVLCGLRIPALRTGALCSWYPRSESSRWILPRLAKRVLQLRYDNHLSYEEEEQGLGVEQPSQQLARSRLRWIGHALRRDDIVHEGGARRRVRLRLRFYDTLKADLAERNAVPHARNQNKFWRLLQEMTADRTN